VKSYRWLTLIAALLITGGEVLVFESQAAQAPQQAAARAVAGPGGSTQPAGSRRACLKFTRTSVWGGHDAEKRTSAAR
jgi:hypothetical protein